MTGGQNWWTLADSNATYEKIAGWHLDGRRCTKLSQNQANRRTLRSPKSASSRRFLAFVRTPSDSERKRYGRNGRLVGGWNPYYTRTCPPRQRPRQAQSRRPDRALHWRVCDVGKGEGHEKRRLEFTVHRQIFEFEDIILGKSGKAVCARVIKDSVTDLT